MSRGLTFSVGGGRDGGAAKITLLDRPPEEALLRKATLPADEGRKRVLAIVARILVARHLKTADDLFDPKPSPRTESLNSFNPMP
jgi:hypothetical protein